MTDSAPRDEVTVVPYRDGPLVIRGSFRIVEQDGTIIEAPRAIAALCRCGRSGARPFCDGSHRLVNFRASGAAEGTARREGRADDQ
jgi:CDGSH-type Zn-finger protein